MNGKPPGWRNEPARHALAARGIRTTSRGVRNLLVDNGYGVGYTADGKKINIKAMKELETEVGGRITNIDYSDDWGYFIIDIKLDEPDKYGEDEAVYQLVMDESEGERIAREYIENDIDDWEEFVFMYNIDSIMEFIDKDALVERLSDDPRVTLDIREKLYSELTETEKEELRDEFGEDVPAVVDYSELHDKIYLNEDDILEDAQEYYRETLEEDIEEGVINPDILRSYFKEVEFVNHAIYTDGWEHFVSRYDGIAHHLSDGIVYWRN